MSAKNVRKYFSIEGQFVPPSFSVIFSRDSADDGLSSNFQEPKILESPNMMIAIAAVFPRWTPRAAAHDILHLSNIAQSSSSSSLPIPLPLLPEVEEGWPSLLLSMSTHR
jgi:hypothetical protein